MAEAENWGERRAELKRVYGEAYGRLNDILFAEDPIGLNFEDNPDEYETETSTILPRLRAPQSATDVRRIVHEEFVRWFDFSTAGREGNYQRIAERIVAEVMPLLS